MTVGSPEGDPALLWEVIEFLVAMRTLCDNPMRLAIVVPIRVRLKTIDSVDYSHYFLESIGGLMADKSLSERMANWMRGRNGSDELGNAVLVIALILLVVDVFVRTLWLGIIVLLLLGYACWRLSSKDVRQRRKENAAFVKVIGPVAPFLSFSRGDAASSQSFVQLECPTCSQKMRVPAGKGRMRVTCPRCQNKFETRS